ERGEVLAVAIVDGRPTAQRVAAVGILDLDDIGAHVREQHAAERACGDVADLDHANAGERQQIGGHRLDHRAAGYSFTCAVFCTRVHLATSPFTISSIRSGDVATASAPAFFIAAWTSAFFAIRCIAAEAWSTIALGVPFGAKRP